MCIKFTEFYFEPESYNARFVPLEVQIGFIQDYINRSLIITDDVIIG